MTAPARALCLFAPLWLAGCSDAPGGLTISDAYGYAPLAPGGPAVAYLTVHNGSDDDIELHTFTSPLFGRVELHATTLADGVSRMRRIDRLRVPARGRAVLQPGGLHLMLRDANGDVAVGTRCPLSAAHGDAGRVEFDVVLMARGSRGESGGRP